MFQGNWKCSSCGGAITELPFQPRSESGLTCRTCYAKSKDQGSSGSAPAAPVVETGLATEAPDIPDFAEVAGEPAPPEEFDTATGAVPAAEKPKFSGDWKCAGCGNAITSLPFEPRSTENLKCMDCFKASKA